MSQGVMSGFYLRTALGGYLNSWIASVVISPTAQGSIWNDKYILLENREDNRTVSATPFKTKQED